VSFDVYDKRCPARRVLTRIADHRTTLVICRLAERAHRFSELERRIGGIDQSTLKHRLRALERDGLVRRTVYAEVPSRVDYRLTPAGEALAERMTALREWAEGHAAASAGS
jgi:DNA-binding HxlR family transcriptional regulator